MGTSILGIAVSGLGAAQSALETISNNISNVNTDGYHRQVSGQQERNPFFSGQAYVGRGVDLAQVNRVYNQFLDTQLSTAVSANSYYDIQGKLVSQIDNLMSSVSSGLTPSMQSFFNSLQTLSSTPTSIPARQTVLNNGQALTGQVQSMAGQLTAIRNNLNGQIQTTVNDINNDAAQLAQLNTQILSLTQGTGNILPNDIMDQRDELIQKLSQLVNVSVVPQSNGTYGVFIGSGQALVLGAQTSPLQTAPSASDPQRLEVAYSVGGSQAIIPENLLTGGQLGGLLNFRSNTLDRADADLGRLAISISDAVNRQYRLGRDLNNNTVTGNITDPTQGLFFSNYGAPSSGGVAGSGLLGQLYPLAPAPAPNSAQQVSLLRQASAQFALQINDPALITTASSLKANPVITMTGTASNTGTLAVNGAAVPPSQTVAGVVNGPISLTYNAGAFTASGGYTATLAAGTLTLTGPNGTSAVIQTTGAPANGDVFTVGSANGSQAFISSVAQVAGTSPSALQPLAAAPRLLLTYNAATQTFTATGPSAAYTVTPSATVAGAFNLTDNLGVNIQFQLSGTPANGDRFVIATKQTGPNNPDNSQTDNSNLQLIDGLQTQNLVINTPAGGLNYLPALATAPNATFQTFFGQTVSYVGSVANVVKSSADSQTVTLNQVQKAQQSFSGVNLDEEAASLIKYQQAYQASSKVIQISNQIFQSLLQLG